ncbi:NYN domain protein [uncultured archaeon]|nr:NYN domain protein [uncultured archaeon]
MDKAAVFIDQGYFSRVLSIFGHQRTETLPDGTARFTNLLDYAKFSDKLCKNHFAERFRTYIYDAPPYTGNPPSAYERTLLAQKQKFKFYLDSQTAFLTRYGACMRIPNKDCFLSKNGKAPCYHITQKGVDVRFSIDLVSLATDRRIDKAILITGDSDFIPAIQYARDQHMKIILYYLKQGGTTIHRGLFYNTDETHEFGADSFTGCLFSQAYPRIA